MGDDLTAARRFCTIVRSDMTSLMDGVCAQPCAEPDILIMSLDRIQSSAKQLHARAIFRAAQTVVNAVNDRAPVAALQGRVLSLNKLITQYENGLDTIAPRPANGDLAVDLNIEETESSRGEDAARDLDARYRAARSALAPLMHFAKPGVEHASLSKLAQFPDTGFTNLNKDIELDNGGDFVFEDETNLIMTESARDVSPRETEGLTGTDVIPPNLASADLTDQPLFTQPSSVQSLRRIDALRQIDFETLMPGFISEALKQARQTDKTVSVSYAAEGVSLSRAQLSAFETVLNHIAITLVGGVLERPETRRSRGASGAGHIAITASQILDKVAVSIECPGKAVSVSAFMPAAQSLEGLTITPGQNVADGHVHIVVTAARKTRTPPLSLKSSHPCSAEIAS